MEIVGGQFSVKKLFCSGKEPNDEMGMKLFNLTCFTRETMDFRESMIFCFLSNGAS